VDFVQTLIDRELLVSAHIHDLSTTHMAVMWALETEVNSGRILPEVELKAQDVATLIHGMRDRVSSAAVPAVLWGERVLALGPVEALEISLVQLPHTRVTVSTTAEAVSWSIEGIPAQEGRVLWTVPMVREWLANGGPGLAYARMCIAARIVGATFTVPPQCPDPWTGVLRMPRA
jgi:hypothetical protein